MPGPWPPVAEHDAGLNVRSVQYLLNDHGAKLDVDGLFGPLTAGAVRQFQSAHGLAVDGIVGAQTWPALIVLVRQGSTGDRVSAVQDQLHARLTTIAVDGVFGPITDEAVRAFQAFAELVVDGIVGPLTWLELATGVLWASDAEGAADAAFTYWTNNDMDAARLVATSDAVNELFARTWSPADNWSFQGSGGAMGSIYSTWTSPTGTLVLRANNSLGTLFFYVTSATFS